MKPDAGAKEIAAHIRNRADLIEKGADPVLELIELGVLIFKLLKIARKGTG